MKRIIAILLITLITFNINMISFAVENEENTTDDVYTTGSLIMSNEELSEFREQTPEIIEVKPNALLYERLAIEKSAVMMISEELETTEFGEELITSWYNNTTTFSGSKNLELPTKVDNSKETTFPTIGNQGDIASCLGWSLGYYQLTNNANRIRGTQARDGSSNIKSRVYSPNWVYNLSGSGDNIGTYGTNATNVLYTYGCPSIRTVPIESTVDSATNYLTWYPEGDIWEEALYNKCDLYYGTINPDKLDTPITSPDSPYLNELKTLLANGYVVTIETYVKSDANPHLPILKITKNKDYVWTEVREVPNSGHAVTIVGYDDNFWVDINGNTGDEDGEYGAFKIANSWGTAAKNHSGGYVWLSYDALNKISSVKSENVANRVPAFRNGDIYYFIKPQSEYKPLLTGEVEIRTENRDDIRVTLGISDSEQPSNNYEKTITSTGILIEDDDGDLTELKEDIAFYRSGGEYNLSGISRDGTGTVIFDFTSLLKEFELKENHRYNIYIKLKDSGETTIKSFKLKDHNIGNIYESNDVPMSTDDSTIKVSVGYLSSIMTAKKDKTFTLTFNNMINQNTVNTSNITIINDDEQVAVGLSLAETEEKIYLSNLNGLYENDFYQITVSQNLRSKGGNILSDNFIHPFYVPFH